MKNETQQKGRIVVRVVAFVLVLLFTAGFAGVYYVTDGFTDWSRFTTDTDEVLDEDEQDDESSVNNSIINESESNGISLLSSRISADEYSDYRDNYGIYINTEFGGYLLEVTTTPSYVPNLAVDWSVTFVSSGANASGYISVTPLTDGALTAVVVRHRALTEQVVITVSLRDDPSIYAECTVDTLPTYSFISAYIDYVSSIETTLTSTIVNREQVKFTSSISLPYVGYNQSIKVYGLSSGYDAGSLSVDVEVNMYLVVLDITSISASLGYEFYWQPFLLFNGVDGSVGYVSFWDVFTDENGGEFGYNAYENSSLTSYIKSNLGTALFAIRYSVSYPDYPECSYDTYIPIYFTES